MTRITVVSGDHGLNQASLFSHPDFNSLTVTLETRTNSVLLFEGRNGFFIRLRGDFNGDNTARWTITALEVGRDDQIQVSATDLEIGFNEYTSITSEVGLINATLSGDDEFVSENDADNIWDTGAGDDTLNLGRGDDLIFAGEGTDRLIINDDFANAEFLDTWDRVSVRSADGTDTLVRVEQIQFNDRLVAIARDFSLTGGTVLRGDQFSATRDDVLLAGEGADTVLGGEGADLLIGEDGDDFLRGDNGEDDLRGGIGNDTLNGDFGDDLLDGGLGDDSLSGGFGDDEMRGSAGNDSLSGGRGQDRMIGGGGADILSGGRQGDSIWGNSGHDNLRGNGGKDRLVGGNGHDTLIGNGGSDTLVAGAGTDRLLGGKHNDILRGGGGNDTLFGGSGDDTLVGGFRNDELFGQRGDDRLVGARGNDTLTGGSGADTFVFNRGHGDNVITDFAIGEDMININSGADDLSDLTFDALGDDVLVSFSNVTILVQDVELTALQDADNFLF